MRAPQTVDAYAAPVAVEVYCRADVRAVMPAVGDVSDARGSVPFRLRGAFYLYGGCPYIFFGRDSQKNMYEGRVALAELCNIIIQSFSRARRKRPRSAPPAAPAAMDLDEDEDFSDRPGCRRCSRTSAVLFINGDTAYLPRLARRPARARRAPPPLAYSGAPAPL